MEQLKNLRAERGLNHSDLAKRAGLSRATLWQLEHDSTISPTLRTLEKLAKALGVSVHALVEDATTTKTTEERGELR